MLKKYDLIRVATSSGQKSGKFDQSKREIAETKLEKAEKSGKLLFADLSHF